MREHNVSLFKERKKIKVFKDKKIYEVEALFEEKRDRSCKLTIQWFNDIIIEADDFFDCLCKMKDKYPKLVFLCKGYKKNVYPSRMTRQMGLGIKAYEMTLGKQATTKDLVWIFDFEDQNLTTSNEEQESFFRQWLSSLK